MFLNRLEHLSSLGYLPYSDPIKEKFSTVIINIPLDKLRMSSYILFYFFLLFAILGHSLALPKKSSSRSEDNEAYLKKGEQPNPGPEMDTVYIPGTPGAAWTKEEVESTRYWKKCMKGCIFLSFLLIVSFSSCQRNLIKTFQIEGMIVLITKKDLNFSWELLNGQK